LFINNLNYGIIS